MPSYRPLLPLRALAVLAFLLAPLGTLHAQANNPQPCTDPWKCYQAPTFDFAATGDATLCIGDSGSYQVANETSTSGSKQRCDETAPVALGPVSYTWSLTGPETANGAGASFSHHFAACGTFTVSFTGTAHSLDSDCPDPSPVTRTLQVTVTCITCKTQPAIGKPSITGGKRYVCVGQSASWSTSLDSLVTDGVKWCATKSGSEQTIKVNPTATWTLKDSTGAVVDTKTGTTYSYTFATPGVYTLSVTVAPDSSVDFSPCSAPSPATSDPVTVTAVKVDSMTVKDKKSGRSATNPSTTCMGIAQCSGDDGTIFLSATYTPNTSDVASHVVWSCAGATPAGGTFANGTQTLTLTDNKSYDVQVGCDANENGSLDSGEADLTIHINYGADFHDSGPQASDEVPKTLLDKANALLTSIGLPKLKKIKFAVSNQLADCVTKASSNCDITKDGCVKTKGELTLQVAGKDLPLRVNGVPLGTTWSRKIWLGVAEVDVDIAVGFFLNLDLSLKGTGGHISDVCDGENCEFACVNGKAMAGVSGKIESIICVESWWTKKHCQDLTVGSIAAQLSVDGKFCYNENSCSDGFSAKICFGKFDVDLTIGGSSPTDPNKSGIGKLGGSQTFHLYSFKGKCFP